MSVLIAAVISVAVLIVSLFKWRFQYWKKIGLKGLNPTIPFGDSKNLILGKVTFGIELKRYYDTFKAQGLKHGGVFLGIKPTYIPVDLEIIKNIFQKDFQHFINHGGYINEEVDPLTGHLFALEDAKWRQMRVKLTPTFTSGKMKMMFQTLLDCTTGLKDIMNDSATKRTPVDIKEILGRFTTDIIGSAAFGLECNSLKDPNAQFRKYGKKVFENRGFDRIKNLIPLLLPRNLLKLIKFKQTNKSVEKFFMKVIKDTVEYREKNNIYRKDFMHLLLQLKNRGKVTDDEHIINKNDGFGEQALTLNELSAQAFVFFLAGFETSSTTMTFALYEIAVNHHVQEKLRKEINSVLKKHDNKLSYDAVMEMTYMDQVINETLRKYPPVPSLPRQCNKDYKVPGTDVTIEKGTQVSISTLGIHMDPEYYPNPSVFDPERFSEEGKKTRPAFAWIPFGEGPRVCIGKIKVTF